MYYTLHFNRNRKLRPDWETIVNEESYTFFVQLASGFQTGIKRRREDEDDGDLNIDGDDSEEYGKPQYPWDQEQIISIDTFPSPWLASVRGGGFKTSAGPTLRVCK